MSILVLVVVGAATTLGGFVLGWYMTNQEWKRAAWVEEFAGEPDIQRWVMREMKQVDRPRQAWHRMRRGQRS